MSGHLRPTAHRRRAVRLFTAAFVVGSAGLAFVPIAYADTTLTLTPTAEAWYQPNPSCQTPNGCLTPGALPAQPPATSPYPARSLHVGLSLGQETARSYLALPLSGITTTITAGTLSIPLDITQADGSSSPELAKLQVCLTSAAVTSVDGSFEATPKTDCSSTAPATYIATPKPRLQADLGPLLDRLPAATGLVLLPDATKAAPTDSWRIVFSAHDRTDAAKTAPATMTLNLNVADEAVEPDVPTVTLPDEDSAGLGGFEAPVGTGFAPGPAVQAPIDSGAAPTVAPPTTTNTTPLAQPQTITVGYAYPAVWLLPLAFLVLVPATARALTKNLARA